MIRRAGISLAVLAALVGPACAEVLPTAGEFDARVRSVTYNELNVTRVVGTPTNSTQIVFAPDEEITFVAVGDADYWLVQPAGHLLFLKPTEVRPETNAQVVTRRKDGSYRSYQLALVSHLRTAKSGAGAIYSVVFTYPGDAQAKVAMGQLIEAKKAAAVAAVKAEVAAQAVLEDSHLQGPRNWRYVASGSTKIQPFEVFDNGSATSFRFPGNMRLPTIYVLSPSGEETIVPYSMHGDMAVVQQTANEFRLRDGSEVLRIVNQAYDLVGVNAQTGTKSADVQRTIRAPAADEPQRTAR